MHVADETVPRLQGRVVDAVDTDVDDDGARLDHVTRNELRLADGDNEDVRLDGHRADVAGARVAHRDRGIPTRSGLQQQRRHRFSHDVGAANDHGVPAGRIDAAAQQELLHAIRRRGPEPGRIPDGDFAHVRGVEAVDVLAGIDAQQHEMLVDVLGERQLNQDAVDLGIGVEAIDEREQVCLARLLGQADGLVMEARLSAGLAFHADVDLGRGVVAHQDHRQPRRDAAGREGGDLGGELAPHLPADRRAVDEFRVTWQRSPPGSREPPRP